MARRFPILIALMFSVSVAHSAVTIGTVRDGPQPRDTIRLDEIQQEIEDLLGGEFEVRFPPDKQIHGDWTADGVNSALNSLLNDPEVDIVLTFGLVASHEAGHIENPRKPLIALIVPDAESQGFPRRGTTSGRHNFTYISTFRSIPEDLEIFRSITGFDKLAVFVDEMTIEAIPAFYEYADETAEQLGVPIDLIPVNGSVDDALAAIPSDADAVYVPPLLRLDWSQMEQLAQGLIDLRLPSMSFLGGREVEQGFLMTLTGQDALQRFSRRVALIVQRVLLGDDPANIDLPFTQDTRPTVNMRTARAIGFSPRWSVLIDSTRLYEEEQAGRSLGLTQAMYEALAANPQLEAARAATEVVAADADLARSVLLPQLNFDGGYQQIDTDRANPFFQAEKQSDAGVTGSQIIYSDSAWAGKQIAAYLYDAATHDLNAIALDTLQAAGDAYLNLLRAQALEKVERSNVEVTRKNLDLARTRERTGFSDRSDALRWESQLATDNQRLLSATADRRAAAINVNRILHRPLGESFSTVESGLDRPMAVVEDPRFKAFVDNPIVWDVFKEFSVEAGLENAPELKAIDLNVLAQERQISASRRSYYIPDFTLGGEAAKILSRRGVGSNPLGRDDEQWLVAVRATIPVYTGGQRRADVSRARYGLNQLEQLRFAIIDSVEARIRSSLEQAGGSYPGIELSQHAAGAANENLELVTLKYSVGAVSVTDLIDAQDAALTANLDAAEAGYSFLIDYLEVSRSTGDFSLVLEPSTAPEWFDEVDQYFEQHGVRPLGNE
ncbi:MAG: TolC family protein [Gammaproteobacteria bacterium]